MPYNHKDELPPVVQTLPQHAQDIYLSSFNNAFKEYPFPPKRKDKAASLEETAHKVAWSAVKKQYHKDEKGNWVKNSLKKAPQKEKKG